LLEIVYILDVNDLKCGVRCNIKVDLETMTSGVWAAIDQRIIENAIAQWLQRLRACGKQKEDISNIFFNSIRKQKLLRTCFTKILKIISCKKWAYFVTKSKDNFVN